MFNTFAGLAPNYTLLLHVCKKAETAIIKASPSFAFTMAFLLKLAFPCRFLDTLATSPELVYTFHSSAVGI